MSTNQNQSAVSRCFDWIQYLLIGIFVLFLGILPFFVKDASGHQSVTAFLCLAVVAWIHGLKRYDLKTMLSWFLITWAVSWCYEQCSISYGFPFGNYHYNQAGPRIGDVPVTVMPSYFAMAYIAWTTSDAITRLFGGRIKGLMLFVQPCIAALTMSMYDLVTDPFNAPIKEQWVWHDGGEFFGVPVQNFLGWILCTYTFFQIFTLLIYYWEEKKGERISKAVVDTKQYWLLGLACHVVMGVREIALGITCTDHEEVYRSMLLLAIFTVIYTSIIAYINIKDRYQSA